MEKAVSYASLRSTTIFLVQDKFSLTNPLYHENDKGELEPIPDDLLISEFISNYPTNKKTAEAILTHIKSEVFHKASKSQIIHPKDVKAVAFKSDPSKAWTRLQFDLNQIQNLNISQLPEFEEFVNLAGNGKDALILWLGSLLDDESSRQQYLHLQGAGGEGKSTLTEAIQKVFGDRCISLSARRLKDNHFGTELEGARLAIFKDENNPSFVQSGEFKEMTGEDTITVNPKYKDPRNIYLSHKTMITSNSKPIISDEEADKRRLLSIVLDSPQISNRSTGWRDQFIASGEKILAYCHYKYLQELKTNPDIKRTIPCPQETLNAAVDRSTQDLKDALESLFDIGQFVPKKITDAKVKRGELHSAVAKKLGRKVNTMLANEIAAELEKMGVKKVRHGGANYYEPIVYCDSVAILEIADALDQDTKTDP